MSMMKIGDFRPWVKKLVPTVYDDTLTYYQLLVRVIGYLNQVIDQGNNTIDYIEYLKKVMVNEQNNLRKDFEKAKQEQLDLIDQYKRELQSELKAMRILLEETKLWLENEALPESVAQKLQDWFESGKLAEIINNEVFDMKADKVFVEKELNQRVGVSYAMFGAKLDGKTDDTEAIRAAHNFANEHGLDIVQKNSTFVLNGNIEVKGNVDLSGSTVITSWTDDSIEYERKNTLYTVVGEQAVDITDKVVQTEFKKGALEIPSLKNIEGGTLIIRTSDLDMLRNDGGNLQNVYKAEANSLTKNSNGKLTYPLTKDYSRAEGFRLLFRPFEEQLHFKMPKIVLKASKIYAFAQSTRNNVKFSGADVEEVNTSVTFAPMHTLIEFVDSSVIEVEDIFCPTVGRKTRTGNNGLGYLLLFTRCSSIRLKNLEQIDGWSGVNGNWFRDIKISDSTLVSASGHANTYDMYVTRTRIYKSISVHGGGVLDVSKCFFDGRDESVAVTTRPDYAAEFEGVINVTDSVAIKSLYFVQLQSVNYDCGRFVYLPDVNIVNCQMIQPIAQVSYLWTWRGFGGNFPASLPNVNVNGYSVGSNEVKHKTIYIPNEIKNSAVNGEVNINVSGAEIPRSTFDSNPYNGDLANIHLPKVTNNSVMLIVNVNDSLANIAVDGMSNIDVTLNNCDAYMLRTLNGQSSVTENGKALRVEYNACRIYRMFTDFGAYSPVKRSDISVIASKFIRYRDKDGKLDDKVGDSLVQLIRRAESNVAEYGSELPPSHASRLFDYLDSDFWIKDGDVKTVPMTAQEPANLVYVERSGIKTVTINNIYTASVISNYGTQKIAELPLGFRPRTRVKFPLSSIDNEHAAILDILSDGTVSIMSRQASDIPAGTSFAGSGTFV